MAAEEGESSKEVPAQPRDERELKAALAIQTPTWLPGATLDFSFRRLWDKRISQFANTTLETANLSMDELRELIDADECGFADLFMRAAQRITERSDPYYRETLARLVGSALTDDAKIDTISYVVDRLLPLEPVHVRILSLLPFETASQAAEVGHVLARRALESSEPRRDRMSLPERLKRQAGGSLPLKNAKHLILGVMARVVRADESVIYTCCVELTAARFLSSTGHSNQLTFASTDLGLVAGRMINDQSPSG